jgi:predicted ArsR family transcriptional regulator
MDQHLAGRVAAVAALDEPTRRRLYQHVVRQPAPVDRDQVAAALQVPRATVAFHLDKLVGEQLLEVTYERRSGRGGPGAGRPAKLYRRSRHHVAVSIPERHYELAGRLLAAAVEESDHSGEPPRAILERRAHSKGKELGESTKADQDGGDRAEILLQALDEHGFEPRTEGSDVLLGNCPFHTLAQGHSDLVCGMNLSLLTGLLCGLGNTEMQADLVPAPDRCCVRLTRRKRTSDSSPT